MIKDADFSNSLLRQAIIIHSVFYNFKDRKDRFRFWKHEYTYILLILFKFRNIYALFQEICLVVLHRFTLVKAICQNNILYTIVTRDLQVKKFFHEKMKISPN